MQLKNIKISNLISFPYVKDLDAMKGIHFEIHKTGNVHTLIGPNGSGKSSFLEILNQTFKVGLTKDYVFDKMQAEKKLQNVIREHGMHVHNLTKHFSHENKDSFVELVLSLQVNDYENIGFVCKFADKLNFIIEKYSTLDVRFSSMDISKLMKISDITCYFSIDFDHRHIILDKKRLSQEERFILHFIQHQELIQICMNIYNDFEKKSGEREWYPLKNTYAILGSNRSFASLVHDKNNLLSISPGKWSRYISGQNTKSYYSTSIGYYLCLMKFWNILSVKHKEAFSFATMELAEIYQDIYRDELLSSKFFRVLDSTIEKYIGMHLNLVFKQGSFIFSLYDSLGHQYFLDELSSGDQSLLFIILTIFGYDLEGGLLVIDEPELHLHPQMQKEFIKFIHEISEEYSLQIILATHSPLMIDETNIHHVYRFSKHNLDTKVDNPGFRIHADEADLIHMLKFENIAKIFFVDKIIMVEGETDAYFFEFYINYLKKQGNLGSSKTVDYEILDIQGKGSFPKWKAFLGKFGITTYFIGDWDNIVDEHIISYEQMQYYRKLSHKYYGRYKQEHKFLSKARYGVLVETIQKTSHSLYSYIIKQINHLYGKGIFFLKKGDLETYIGIQTKGLEDTIFFCQKKFPKRIENSLFDEHREELDEIFSRILKG